MDHPETQALDAPPAPPCTIVLFGAAGDLTKRLLVPALYNLAGDGLIGDGFKLIGADHNDCGADSWRNELHEAIVGFTKDTTSEFHAASIDEKRWSKIAGELDYVVIDFENAAAYQTLKDAIEKSGGGNVVFYLAVGARFFATIVENLGKAGLLKETDDAFRRVIIEKPFGSDLASARHLNKRLLSVASEEQLYRIDHFLGKDAVQGIFQLRFANGIFEPLWRREHLSSVQITAAEVLGVEERGSFYELTGALRDMIPNHLFSVLTMLAMETPGSLGAGAVRAEKAKLVRAIRPVDPANAARGAYAAGHIGGKAVVAYRDEDRVAKDSRTETYAALTAYVDNERWSGVPFYVRTGKRMRAHKTVITLHLRSTPPMFANVPGGNANGNVITLGVDPDQRVTMSFTAKAPGPVLTLGPVCAGFEYAAAFPEKPAVGYESLLYDCMRGNAINFNRGDAIEAAWAAAQPVIDAWSNSSDAPQAYEAGSDGPAAADAMLRKNGDAWDAIA